VLTHGFLIDVDGRKMSKSLGNTVQPQEVIKESGAEILRLWVAMSDFREELRVGKQILARVIEAYRKIRNTLRYLVSNLYDFDPATDRVPIERLQEVDRFAVSRYAEMASAVVGAYDRYDYPTIFQTLNQYLTVDLSAFYADVSKDRLYTFAASSNERRSAQTAMYIMADGLARLLAPILPITADELWRHLPDPREDSVHIALFPSGFEALRDEALDARWAQLLSIRDEVNRALEVARQSKEIGTSLAARVTLSAGGAIGALLRQYEADLPMLLIVSQVSLQQTDTDAVSVAVWRAEGEKCQRCWRVLPDVSHDADTEGLCSRCIAALAGDLPSAAA
jgi:isoleucyl-tRNA synthetase